MGVYGRKNYTCLCPYKITSNVGWQKVEIVFKRTLRGFLNFLSLSYNDVELQITTGDKILGVNIDENLIWNNHFQCVCKKCLE